VVVIYNLVMIKIPHRHTGAVLVENEQANTESYAVSAAIDAGVDLSGADLHGVNFAWTDLHGANFSGADLRGANFGCADLRDVNFENATLNGATFSGAKIARARFSLDDVPQIENIHQAIFAAVSQPGALNMSYWHTCETTHCRGGWAIELAGASGRLLEARIGAPAAAALIYLKSDPAITQIPDFYASNDAALADMKRLAGLAPAHAISGWRTGEHLRINDVPIDKNPWDVLFLL
jgi:hypothetical protein